MSKFKVFSDKKMVGGLWQVHYSGSFLDGLGPWDGVTNDHRISIERRPLSGLYTWFYGPPPAVGDVIDFRFVKGKFTVERIIGPKSLRLTHEFGILR